MVGNSKLAVSAPTNSLIIYSFLQNRDPTRHVKWFTAKNNQLYCHAWK